MAQNEDVTLYFIAGSEPTAADEARAAKIPGIVRFRNVDEIGTDFEESDYVTAAPLVDIPEQYDETPLRSPEKPLSLEIVPNNPSADLSDVEHLDLRAIARFMDGTAVDVTTDCAWSSATEANATVGAATGIVTPVQAGTSVITAEYAFAAPGEEGVVYASKALTASSNPAANDTVAIGGVTYTFKATVAATANEVLIGATKEETLENLKSAVNLEPNTGQYGTATVVNPNAIAEIDSGTPAVLTAIAKAPGTVGNAVAVAESSTALAWAGGATELSGGTDATETIEDTTTVTVVA